MGRRIAGLVVLLLLWGGVASAHAATGSVTGRVTDATGAPLGGVTVEALGDHYYQRTDTRSDGFYRLEPVYADRYVVSFHSQGPWAGQFYDSAASSADATRVTVADGEARQGVDARLQPGATISGRVTDSRGVGVRASVLLTGDADQPTTGAVSDDDGSYVVRGVPAGSYAVEAEPARDRADARTDLVGAFHPAAATLDGATRVDVPQRGAATGVDVRLPLAGRVAGRVVDQDGLPVPGSVVSVFGPSPGSAHPVASDGSFAVDGLFPGRYEVWGQADGYTWETPRDYDVPEGGSVDGLRFVLRPTPPPHSDAVLAGRVTTASGAVTGASVTVEGADGSDVSGQAGTDANGRWRIGVHGTGHAHVHIDPYDPALRDTWLGDAPDAAHARVVDVAPGATVEGLDQALRPGLRVTGSLQLRSGPFLGAAAVELQSTSDDRAPVRTTPARDGTWTADGLWPGTYRVDVRPWDSGLDELWWPAGRTPDAGATLTVAEGSTPAPVDVVLHRRGSVAGRIVDPSDAPVAGARVVVSVPTTPGQEVATTSGADGRYAVALEGLGGGDVVVRATGPAGSGLGQVWSGGATTAAAARPIAVDAGADVDVGDLALLPGQPVTGRLRGDDGSTPADAQVTVLDARGAQVTQVAASPTFATPVLPAGSYRLRVTAPGYWPEFYEDAADLATATPVVVGTGGAPPALTMSLEPRLPSGALPDEPGPDPATTSGTEPAPTATLPSIVSPGPLAGPGRPSATAPALVPPAAVAPTGATLAAPASALQVRQGAVAVPLRCGRAATCAGSLRVVPRRGAPTVLARGAFSLRAGVRRTAVVRLTARGRAAVRRSARVPARLVLTLAGGRTTRSTVVLRRR